MVCAAKLRLYGTAYMPGRYYSLSEYFRNRFACRVRKIPLDAGATCPNRDNALSGQGCLFCNERGSGTGLWRQGFDLARQWELLRGRTKSSAQTACLAYLQSFSNTYAPLARLQTLLQQIVNLPDLAGLCIGTRPDCLEREKLFLLARQNIAEIWLDIGLQSCHDRTLAMINRGHDFACFAQSCVQAADLRLKVCAHVIAGLPGETPALFLETIKALNDLPVAGLKFHNLYVARGARLALLWQSGQYQPLERELYLHEWLLPALQILRPDIVVHRLMADPARGELLAPQWTADKAEFLQLFSKFIKTI